MVCLYLFTAVRVVWNKMHKGQTLIFIWEYFIALNEVEQHLLHPEQHCYTPLANYKENTLHLETAN